MPVNIHKLLGDKTRKLGGVELLDFQQYKLFQTAKKEYKFKLLSVPEGFCWALSHYYLNSFGDYDTLQNKTETDRKTRKQLIIDQNSALAHDPKPGKLVGHTFNIRLQPASQELLRDNFIPVSAWNMSQRTENIYQALLQNAECGHSINMMRVYTSGHTIAIFEDREYISIFEPNAGAFGFSKQHGRTQAIRNMAILFETVLKIYVGYPNYQLSSYIPKRHLELRSSGIFYGSNPSRLIQVAYIRALVPQYQITHQTNQDFNQLQASPRLKAGLSPQFDMMNEEDFISTDTSDFWRHIIFCYAFLAICMKTKRVHLLTRNEYIRICDLPPVISRFSKVKSDRSYLRVGDLLRQHSFLMHDISPEIYHNPTVYTGVDDAESFSDQLRQFSTECNIIVAQYVGGITVTFAMFNEAGTFHLYNANWGLFTFREGSDTCDVCNFFVDISHKCFATEGCEKVVDYYLMCFERRQSPSSSAEAEITRV